MKKQEQKKNSFIMTKQGDLHTITSTKQTGGNDKGGEVFKFMGVAIITVAVGIVIGGCLSLIYVAFKIVTRNRETYHQFEEEKRASSGSNNGEQPRINVAEIQ
jgi:hypothetical protein